MPRDGSGVYTLPTGNPVVDGTAIEADWANDTMNDLANEITGSLPRNGVAPMTGALAMGNKKITGLANGTAATDAVSLGQADAKYAIEAAANTFTAVQEISVNTATPALKVTQAGAGNVLELLDVAGDVSLVIVDAEGALILGHTADIPVSNRAGTSVTPRVQNIGIGSNTLTLSLQSYVASGLGNNLHASKSRGVSAGLPGALQDGDQILSLIGAGSGSTITSLRSSGIYFDADGAFTDTSAPGRVSIWTTPASSVVPVERLRFSNAGAFGLSGANYGTAGQVLVSAGSAAPPVWGMPSNATTSAVGAVELATAAETQAVADPDKAVTPLSLAKMLPKAWVVFDGTTNVGGNCTMSDNFNVASVTDNGTGDYTINFNSALPHANYAVVITTSGSAGSAYTGFVETGATYTKTVNAVRIRSAFSNASSNNYIDSTHISVLIFG